MRRDSAPAPRLGMNGSAEADFAIKALVRSLRDKLKVSIIFMLKHGSEVLTGVQASKQRDAFEDRCDGCKEIVSCVFSLLYDNLISFTCYRIDRSNGIENKQKIAHNQVPHQEHLTS